MTNRVMHLLKTYDRAGGTIRTSLCGRVRTTSDGMNLTAEPAEATCSFCRRLLNRLAGKREG
jgi:hypothetical protein